MKHTSHRRNASLYLAVVALTVFATAGPAVAVTFDIPQPDGKTNFVTDMVDLLDPDAEQRINDPADVPTERRRLGDPTAALCETLKLAGEKLGEVLPRADDDTDELPNALILMD
ncbi:MAG: hypothetical protein GVY16_01100 [Planctomycetes bacterium]|jgi:hypothetical protein|nr:hypothetical protein [Phycisphaerae bacterium]NBB94323.1 hypothetical protein [Planctomycetota bacterium]